ncbi:DUF6090 family protein [Lutimonas zeaxanthinifaciens]|uniref:DUF6090 family protein n=1 Tax=Lutimonas zeaxanthinifaciens TaxID=3060215 RepID=UPI00265D0BC4|nr:DUF6090 family protein [Lutimonas sp. YSD2104]WKK67529.1 DUF6090 family protein [Lutimonas sp. YSD2104]
MADDNRPLKYARYAIGEIILVVIGILIALQINTWNEERKAQKKACFYLIDLKESLLNTKVELKRVIDKSRLSYMASDTLDRILFHKYEIPDFTLDTIIQGTYGYTIYSPHSGVINEIMNSGELELFKNNFIRKTVASWDSRLNNIAKFESDGRLSFLDYTDLMLNYIDQSNIERNKPVIIEAKREEFFNDHKVLNLNFPKMRMQRILNDLYIKEMILIDSLESEINKELQKCNK